MSSSISLTVASVTPSGIPKAFARTSSRSNLVELKLNTGGSFLSGLFFSLISSYL